MSNLIMVIIGIILGFMAGAIGIYFAQQKKLKLINQKLHQTRRLLEESDDANRENVKELQKLKQEQDKIRQLQAEQGAHQDELQRSYQAEIKQLEVMAETKIQELESNYNSHLKVLELERQENLRKIEQYQSQIQALESQIQALIEGDTIGEAEEEARGEQVQEIESLLDLLADLVTEPSPELPVTDSERATKNIKAIAALNTASDIPQLSQYIYESDSKNRALVANVFGKIAEEKSQGLEIKRVISNLGKLSRDSDPTVRQSAVTALGKISSVEVVPLLKMAQRDTDSNVVKSASAALEKFKSYRAPQKKKALPQNASAIVE